MITPEELMSLALEQARKGVQRGQSPFGCAIAIDGRVAACAHNSVVAHCDITAHAEIKALREACRRTGEILLPGAVVATTCEPCAMCMAALHWARVETVYYGATIADAAAAGFNELELAATDLVRLAGSPVKVVGQLMAEPCQKLFDQWLERPDRRAY